MPDRIFSVILPAIGADNVDTTKPTKSLSRAAGAKRRRQRKRSELAEMVTRGAGEPAALLAAVRVHKAEVAAGARERFAPTLRDGEAMGDLEPAPNLAGRSVELAFERLDIRQSPPHGQRPVRRQPRLPSRNQSRSRPEGAREYSPGLAPGACDAVRAPGHEPPMIPRPEGAKPRSHRTCSALTGRGGRALRQPGAHAASPGLRGLPRAILCGPFGAKTRSYCKARGMTCLTGRFEPQMVQLHPTLRHLTPIPHQRG